jgi:hypothetical protein
MGIEPELAELLIIQLLGNSFFSHFEGETPAWKKILKWLVFDGLIIGLYFICGHRALLLPVILLIPGAVVHIRWCRKHGIHPVKATPKRKYYGLRGWKWPE